MIDHLAEQDVGGHLLAKLSIAERRLGAAMAARMTPHDVVLRGSHARLLHVVPVDGARPSELANGWISKQAVGKRIQEMVDAGLVSIERDPSDGRASIVRRTAEGDRVVTLVMSELAGLEAELAQNVGERRYRTFRAVLDELASG
jgi:DNA-binding MarR family transcriptional regulator